MGRMTHPTPYPPKSSQHFAMRARKTDSGSIEPAGRAVLKEPRQLPSPTPPHHCLSDSPQSVPFHFAMLVGVSCFPKASLAAAFAPLLQRALTRQPKQASRDDRLNKHRGTRRPHMRPPGTAPWRHIQPESLKNCSQLQTMIPESPRSIQPPQAIICLFFTMIIMPCHHAGYAGASTGRSPGRVRFPSPPAGGDGAPARRMGHPTHLLGCPVPSSSERVGWVIRPICWGAPSLPARRMGHPTHLLGCPVPSSA